MDLIIIVIVIDMLIVVVVNVIVINTIVLTPRHTGVNISLGLDKMIESLGLNNGKRKLWSVNDNASNMKVAIRESEP